MSKHIPSSGSRGEVAAMQALQSAGFAYRWQVPIKTRFSAYTYLIDFLVWPKYGNPRPVIVLEIDGGFHRKTWGGKTAVKRMAKDAAKDECLKAEGYKVLRIVDSEAIKHPEVMIQKVREALA